MADAIYKEEIDLLYVVGKLKYFAPYKFFLVGTVFFGAMTGIFFSVFISPLRVEIEYHTPKYKSVIPGSNFESTTQSFVAGIITSGKLSSFRDSSGFIYRFIISGEGQSADSAKIRALENSSELINKNLKNSLTKLIDSYIRTEASISYVGSSDEISGELALREFEKKLNRLQAVRSKMLIDEALSFNLGADQQIVKYKKFDGLSGGEQRLRLNKDIGEERLTAVDAEIIATKVDIGMLRMSIEGVKSGAIPETSINQFSQLVTLASNDDSITALSFIKDALALISRTEKFLDINSGAFDRLVYLKLSLQSFDHASKLIQRNGKVLNPEKKYKILYCGLGGGLLSLLISALVLVFRSDIIKKYRFKN
jgi:hypothetical protein